MSDHHVTIVDIDVTLADAPAQAQRIIAWLQSEGIVSEGVRVGDLWQGWLISIGSNADIEPTKDDTIVYPPGPNVRRACTLEDPTKLFHNWLEVGVGREVYTAGENGIGIYCPSCNAEQTELGRHWSEAISIWYEGTPETLKCAICSFEAPLRKWNFDPVWGLGNLGFQFSNWNDLEPGFIAEFLAQLGSEARVVHTHL